MRKLMFASVLICPALLASCTAPSVAEIQAATKTACGFAPIAATIVSIVNANVGATAGSIAAAICQSALAQKASRRFSGATINAPINIGGNIVVVRGHF